MVTIQTHDANLPVGENRQRMLERSSGEYVNFVDDDDLVTEDYAAAIYPHLGKVDVVAFPMKIATAHGVPKEQSIFQPLTTDEQPRNWGWCRDILHLSPLRREIALSFPMEGAAQEDVRWAGKIRRARLIHTQATLDHPLYTYYPGASRPIRIAEPAPQPKIFYWQTSETSL